MKHLFVFGVILFAAVILGCSSEDKKESKSGPDSNGSSVVETSNESGELVRLADPKVTVETFLNSLKAGDKVKATAMLTVKAQRETADNQMAIRPPGSSSAEFSVIEAEEYENDEAQVLSTWTDSDSRGIVQTYDIVWMLKKEHGGWAVQGMATRVFEDQQPLILNFESPAEMLRETQRAEQEIARRQQQANEESQEVAAQPQKTSKR